MPGTSPGMTHDEGRSGGCGDAGKFVYSSADITSRMGEIADAALARDEVLSGLLAYWRGKLRGRAMPRRADIDPAEIPRLLPHLQLVERIDGRYRYRLAGTAIVAAYGA